MYQPITQEFMAEFCENTIKEIQTLKDHAKIKNEMVSNINESIIAINLKIETNRILLSEKHDNMIFRLSVINDKMIAVEQKINELNKIMMKHFAYKEKLESKKNNTTPIHIPTQIPIHIPTQIPIQTPIPIPTPGFKF